MEKIVLNVERIILLMEKDQFKYRNCNSVNGKDRSK